jgi:hypothetical protein
MRDSTCGRWKSARPDRSAEEVAVVRVQRRPVRAGARSPGDYDVFVSVGQRDGTPTIALPLPDDDGQRRYKLGRMTLRDP